MCRHEIELRGRGPGDGRTEALVELIGRAASGRRRCARVHRRWLALMLHRHACAELSRIALVVDAPAALLQRHDAVGGRLEPVMLAWRGEPEHPVAQISGGHRRAEPRFELVPRGVGFELPAVAGLAACRSGVAASPRICNRTLPTPTGPRICTSARSPRCCQSNDPEPPLSGPDTPSRPRACQRIELPRDRVARSAWAACGAVAQPRPSAQQQKQRRDSGDRRCMAAAAISSASAGAASSRRCRDSARSPWSRRRARRLLRSSASSTSPRCRSTSGSLMRRLACSRYVSASSLRPSAMQRPAHAVEHRAAVRRLRQRLLDELQSFLVLARAIDQRVAERVDRGRIAGPIGDELAQLGDRLVHFVGGLELEHAGEAQLGRVRVFLRGAVEQRERAVDVTVVREQVRARDDGLDPVLRARRRELFEMLQARHRDPDVAP